MLKLKELGVILLDVLGLALLLVVGAIVLIVLFFRVIIRPKPKVIALAVFLVGLATLFFGSFNKQFSEQASFITIIVGFLTILIGIKMFPTNLPNLNQKQ